VTVVRVKSPSRFIEIEPLDGSRRGLSRLPQYLMKAILGWARAVKDVISKVYHEAMFL
jgi:hypothetical protein